MVLFPKPLIFGKDLLRFIQNIPDIWALSNMPLSQGNLFAHLLNLKLSLLKDVQSMFRMLAMVLVRLRIRRAFVGAYGLLFRVFTIPCV